MTDQQAREVLSRKARRRALLAMVEAQGGLCAYCDTPMQLLQGPRMATWEHVAPVVEGGTDDSSNAVAACWQCNRLKGALTVEQIRRLADRIEAFGPSSR